MNETSKCYKLRKKENHFRLYLCGKGIDIGCGHDILAIEFGSVHPWDLSQGDAMLMSGVEEETYDFAYSSHCLEHLECVEIALYNWSRILKKDGYLYFTVPEYVLYEKMTFPSVYNCDHKNTFSYYIERKQTKRENHYNYKDINQILEKLKMEVIMCKLEDENYDYNKYKDIDQTMGNALAQILFVAKKKDQSKLTKKNNINFNKFKML